MAILISILLSLGLVSSSSVSADQAKAAFDKNKTSIKTSVDAGTYSVLITGFDETE